MKTKARPKQGRAHVRNRRIGSRQAAADVTNAIECITTIPKGAIVVTVDQGWVRLEGRVPTWNQKDTVQDVVQHLEGVKGVLNLIEVEPTGPIHSN